ncbi:MAG: hypothetical protein ACYC8T_12010 [Myxococcaceae bacterium]
MKSLELRSSSHASTPTLVVEFTTTSQDLFQVALNASDTVPEQETAVLLPFK